MTVPDKETALDLFEVYREDYLAAARGIARAYAQMWGEVCIDDVWELCPPPKDIDPKVMGGVIRGKEWKHVAYVRSRRPAAHGRIIGMYKLKE